MRKSFLFVLIMAVVMLVTAAIPALAQENNTDQLTTLFQMFMQQVQKTTAVPTLEPIFEPTATLTPIPEITDIPDVDSYTGTLEGYSDAELLQLLQLLMQQLDKTEALPEVVTEEPATAPEETPVPTAAPEIKVFDIYENKKLIIGNMPSYMFIQPTAIPEPENKPDTPSKKKDPNLPTDPRCDGYGYLCSDGTWAQCVCTIRGDCFWTCMKG